MTKKRILEIIREICLGLPETSERPSHGAPAFFVRSKRSFATVWDSHHGGGRFALICAAPARMQAALVGTPMRRLRRRSSSQPRAARLDEEAGGRTRTDGPRLTRALLYQLSYSGTAPA